MQRIRIASTSRQADDWALVLTAIGIPHAIAPDAAGWALLTAPDDAARANAALTAYDEERLTDGAPLTAAPAPYPWMSGVALGLLLLWLFSVTGTPGPASRWFDRGAAVAGAIVAGEAWRTITALTMHVDVVHVTGNALAVAVLFPPLVQRLGGGGALLFVLAAGALGNAGAAAAHEPRHLAVGASTAAFGAVGMLVALRFFPDGPPPSRKRWTAPVAGVILLATLGVSRGADVTAHVSGFLAGVVLGILAGVAVRRPPAPVVQWMLGGLSALLALGAWAIALR